MVGPAKKLDLTSGIIIITTNLYFILIFQQNLFSLVWTEIFDILIDKSVDLQLFVCDLGLLLLLLLLHKLEENVQERDKLDLLKTMMNFP